MNHALKHSFLTIFAGLFSVVTHAQSTTSLQTSSFNEVRDVISDKKVAFSNSDEQDEFKVYKSGALPHYEVTAESFIEHGVNALVHRAIETTTEKFDYYPRLKKLVHPNGICVTGTWTITEASDYTGYFSKNSKALYIGRASVTMSATETGSKRGFGFAGKLFPTNDPDEKVATANFFSVDVLLGTRAQHFTDVSLTNEPDTGFGISDFFNFKKIDLGKRITAALTQGDQNPTFRPVYPIAELGVRDVASAKSPHWVMFRAASNTAKIDQADFREELNIAKNYPRGLRYEIFASDITKDSQSKTGWQRLGQIDLKESFVSYGCDRRLHFPHPKIK